MIAILDASAFAPIVISDEREMLLPGVQEGLSTSGFVVPSHWHMEVANLLLVAMRRGRIERADLDRALRTVSAVIVDVDRRTREALFKRTWELSARHNLTIYDAAYLELADRLRLPLATSDRALIAAANHDSIELFGR